MLQILNKNRTKILVSTIAIAMILLYTMSFSTTVFAASENNNRPEQSYTNNGKNDSDKTDKPEKEDKADKPEKEDKAKVDTSGTMVRYHIQLSKGELKNLKQITLTITFEDENGDTVTDEVIMTTADHQGNHFTGNFAGTYRENSKTIVGYNAVIRWTATSDSVYEIDHQSNNGFGANSVINVFTKGKAANETEPEDLDDEENKNDDENDDQTSPDGMETYDSTVTTGGSTGNTGNTGNNVTIGEAPVPKATINAAADDTTPEMVQTVILDEEAIPLAEVPADSSAPQTGVTEDSALLLLMLLGSLAGVAFLARKRDTIME